MITTNHHKRSIKYNSEGSPGFTYCAVRYEIGDFTRLEDDYWQAAMSIGALATVLIRVDGDGDAVIIGWQQS